MPFWIADLCVLNVALVVDEKNVSVIVFCPEAREFQQSLEPFLVTSGHGSFSCALFFLVTL
jgi:hypothetical protein